VLGERHPETVSSLNNLGIVLQAMGNLEGARPYLERALAIYETELGPDHAKTRQTRRNLSAPVGGRAQLTGLLHGPRHQAPSLLWHRRFDSHHVRKNGARMGLFEPDIEKMKEERDVEGLIKALRDAKDARARSAAAEALAQVGDGRAIEPLAAALKDKDASVRRQVAEALGKIGGAGAIKPLIAALKDPDHRARQNAVQAFGAIGDARAVKPLIAALTDPDRDVCGAAAWVLGRVGDATAVKPLISVLRDRNPIAREAAASVLVAIGGPGAERALIEFDERCREEREKAERKGKARG